ncbi:MAG: hypothetical protein LBV00_01605 [Propionibacteriaceae bacterium]|jgi:hypothetical protein|nr:hypothetical protein [Propionibacteriaceae bacterium]
MSEMAQTADHVVIIGRGRLIADAPMSRLLERASGVMTKVRSPEIAPIVEAAQAAGCEVVPADDGAVIIKGWSARFVGEEASSQGWVLYELTPLQRSLEEVYMELTESAVEFQALKRTDGASQAASEAADVVMGSAANAPSSHDSPRSSTGPEPDSTGAEIADEHDSTGVATAAEPDSARPATPPEPDWARPATPPEPPRRSPRPSAKPAPAPATATLSTLANGHGAGHGAEVRSQATPESTVGGSDPLGSGRSSSDQAVAERPEPEQTGAATAQGVDSDSPQAKPRRAWVEE